MKTPLNASKKTDFSSWFLKKSKKHLKNKLSLVKEAKNYQPKTSCKYSETKKVKQVHRVIPDLKHELLS